MDTCAHPDLPPVTEQHLQHAYLIIRPKGVNFAAVMAMPPEHTLRRVIEIKAHQLRTEAWLETQQHHLMPIRRCRLGANGQPVGWITQRAPGSLEPIQQPDLYQ